MKVGTWAAVGFAGYLAVDALTKKRTGKRLHEHLLSRAARTDERFVDGLLQVAAQQISNSLALDIEKVLDALAQCRVGSPNDLARRIQSRVDCSLKKTSASRVSVTLSVSFLKEGKPLLTQVRQEASWDDLPSEIRAEFIRKNPPELCYVLCESSAMPPNTIEKTRT